MSDFDSHAPLEYEPAHGFIRTDTGRIVLRVDELERGLLSSLFTQIIDLLDPELIDPDPADHPDPLAQMVGIAESAQRPADAALARLLPDAYADDDAASVDFRRYTERDLRDGKIVRARIALDMLATTGPKITLSEDQAEAWMLAINDVRLALGTRLGIEEENHEALVRRAETDPSASAIHVYDWLTYLAETLVRCLWSQD